MDQAVKTKEKLIKSRSAKQILSVKDKAMALVVSYIYISLRNLAKHVKMVLIVAFACPLFSGTLSPVLSIRLKDKR